MTIHFWSGHLSSLGVFPAEDSNDNRIFQQRKKDSSYRLGLLGIGLAGPCHWRVDLQVRLYIALQGTSLGHHEPACSP